MSTKIKAYIIKRICKVALIISLFIFAGLISFIFVERAYYHDYYANSKKEFEVPGLNENFVPQGLEYIAEYDEFLICGYLSNNNEAKIYVVNKDGSYREISVKSPDGSSFKNHAGGIVHHKEYIYIAGCDGYVYVLSSKEIMSKGTKSATVIGKFQANNNATFIAINGNELFVGEFYFDLKYSTNELHHMVTPAGEQNNAIMLGFSLNDSNPLGVEPEANLAFSIPGRIQGMCVPDNIRLVLSASSIFSGSQLYTYDLQSVLKRKSYHFKLDNKEIPLYYLDRTSLIDKKEILPKAEGIVYRDGRIYTLYESASNRFMYGKLLDEQYLYSIKFN